ncbi:hypothetical protein FHR90_003224 [Endobacter medicaginis]|uniref:SH3 domain-containing protein n=1 Tax=Endobacter medicaginis TaxID=1181271 RepID=A0A850NTX1_9PROT|nr:hypothetical protein [Endobacter medicaginis]MBB3175369.1 hypothetical protein [Endobacter medicaginis]MCX5476904.1 hypothetical protein [Endobacter medicaginis]NVN31226.1 hypothetical protein [Endobacter medicaginis]
MTRSHLLLAAALAAGFASTAARAQPAPDANDLKQLDHDAMERAEHGPARNWGPPVPQSSIAQPKLSPLPIPATCMGVADDSLILAAPVAGSKSIGTTGDSIADTGVVQAGYHQVLYRGRTTGWVLGSLVHPYRNKFNPSAKCTLMGETSTGAVGYSIR